MDRLYRQGVDMAKQYEQYNNDEHEADVKDNKNVWVFKISADIQVSFTRQHN